MAQIDPDDWDRLFDAGRNPCAAHAYLHTLETTGCVGPETGWTPAHHVLVDESGALTAAAPVYDKSHSYGEFVFDFAWANALHRVGIAYYPKRVCAIPFTPVPGPRVAGIDDDAVAALAGHLRDAASQSDMSSMHVLFPDPAPAGTSSWLQRRDVRFVWHNRVGEQDADFEAFLAQLSSKRRKDIRRECRRVAEAGISFRERAGDQLDDAEWRVVYERYARTYLVRGQRPYLTPTFFPTLAGRMPGRVRVTEALHNGQVLAVAIALQGDDTLFGRHWGTSHDVDGLHFVTCYYQGIAHCLAQGLAHYDAGVQGEQKRARGFEPVMTRSLHWIDHPGLRDAVADFLRAETDAVGQWCEHAADRSAYRKS